MCNQISLSTALSWYQDASERVSLYSRVTTKTPRRRYDSMDD